MMQKQDRLVKINVHEKLVPLPTRSLNDSLAEELARTVNLDIDVKCTFMHLTISDASF
jgi:hypothetical protein